MSVPEFKPLPYSTPEALMAAFQAGAMFMAVEPSRLKVQPIIKMDMGYGFLRCWEHDGYVIYKGDGSQSSGDRSWYLVANCAATLAPAEDAEACRQYATAMRDVLPAACVMDSDDAGIKAAAVDLSYFNPPPIEPKRQCAGLLKVWNPDRRTL